MTFERRLVRAWREADARLASMHGGAWRGFRCDDKALDLGALLGAKGGA